MSANERKVEPLTEVSIYVYFESLAFSLMFDMLFYLLIMEILGNIYYNEQIK